MGGMRGVVLGDKNLTVIKPYYATNLASKPAGWAGTLLFTISTLSDNCFSRRYFFILGTNTSWLHGKKNCLVTEALLLPSTSHDITFLEWYMIRGFHLKSSLTFPYNNNINLLFIGLCPGNHFPVWCMSSSAFSSRRAFLITTKYLLGNRSVSLYLFLKSSHEIISSYFVRIGSLPMCHYSMNATSLKFIKPPPTSLKWIPFSTHSRGVFEGVSLQHLHFFTYLCLQNAILN